MTICYLQAKILDKDPSSVIWMPGPDGWKCLKGPRFTYNVVLAEGALDTICAELQALRDSCPQPPAAGWHTAYILCRIIKGPTAKDLEPPVRHTDNGLLVTLRMCVTDDEQPFGEGEYLRPPPGVPLTPFGAAIREAIEYELKKEEHGNTSDRREVPK